MVSGPNWGQNGRFARSRGFEACFEARPAFSPISLKLAVSAQSAADIEEFLPALFANRFGIEIAQFVQRLRDGLAGECDHALGIAMRPARRLLENPVDHPETQHILRRDLHAGGSFLRFGAVTPQNR